MCIIFAVNLGSGNAEGKIKMGHDLMHPGLTGKVFQFLSVTERFCSRITSLQEGGGPQQTAVLYRGGVWSSRLGRDTLRWSSVSCCDTLRGKGMKYIGGRPSCSLRLHASLSICSSLKRLHALQKVVQNKMERPKPRMPRKILDEEEEEMGKRRMRKMKMRQMKMERVWEMV